MTRRGLFGILAGDAAAIAIAFDLERALWVPGAKLISIPIAIIVRRAAAPLYRARGHRVGRCVVREDRGGPHSPVSRGALAVRAAERGLRYGG